MNDTAGSPGNTAGPGNAAGSQDGFHIAERSARPDTVEVAAAVSGTCSIRSMKSLVVNSSPSMRLSSSSIYGSIFSTRSSTVTERDPPHRKVWRTVGEPAHWAEDRTCHDGCQGPAHQQGRTAAEQKRQEELTDVRLHIPEESSHRPHADFLSTISS